MIFPLNNLKLLLSGVITIYFRNISNLIFSKLSYCCFHHSVEGLHAAICLNSQLHVPMWSLLEQLWYLIMIWSSQWILLYAATSHILTHHGNKLHSLASNVMSIDHLNTKSCVYQHSDFMETNFHNHHELFLDLGRGIRQSRGRLSVQLRGFYYEWWRFFDILSPVFVSNSSSQWWELLLYHITCIDEKPKWNEISFNRYL